ncbi:uncharacterized protein LOC133179905 [Saccostrea echinata]|uniref:uncharacterized protein LOC133179905 n=1 Tax=Saccostrea echinata TaxID=191078 RepID=UPI002A805371|nr:uncharacterized protein LOC133179905 [Saccostrea echinata]
MRAEQTQMSQRSEDGSASSDNALNKRLIRVPLSALQKIEQSDEKESMNRNHFESPLPNTALGLNENDTDDLHLTQDEMREILDAKENETSVSMIDFAGQFAYYACHQIYMRSEAFYILVMDMSKAFQDAVNSETNERQGSIFSTWTYKDYLYFWLDSIKSFSGTSAQILVVATHAEGKTDEEKDSFWESLWTLLPEYDKTRIYDSDFALGLLEMNEQGRHALESLKTSIADVVSQIMDTGIEVPSAWALLEHLLKKTEKPILSISDINEENKKLPEEYQLKSQEEIYDFLSFFHSHGVLLFFMEEGLKTHAILGIQWFSDAFSKLIADKSHINRDCQRRHIKEWDYFNATGNLKNSLVDALWKKEQSYLEHKTELMAYMERLRMLVNIGESEGEISWYVPCMNNKRFTRDVCRWERKYSSILSFRFISFAMFVYYRLIAYCMSFLKWNVQLDKENSLCLYHTAAIFETQNHTVIVGIIDNDLQIQVLRIKNLNPKVSCEIGKTIEFALTELTKTFDEKKSFVKGYKCLNLFCSEDDMSFIPENKLSGVQCNCPIEEKHEMDVQWTLYFWKEDIVCDKNPKSFGRNLDGRTRFAKLGMAINDVLTQTYRDILEKEIPSSQIMGKVELTKRYKNLHCEQQNLLKDAKNSGYKKFDITLLYTLMRNFSTTTPRPTHGWGLKAPPAAGEITVGDDIERIRLIRNKVYGHVNSASVSQAEFDDNWSIISDICKRLETYTGKSYSNELDNIKKLSLGEDSREAIIEKIKVNKEILDKMQSMETGIQSIQIDANLIKADLQEIKLAVTCERKDEEESCWPRRCGIL